MHTRRKTTIIFSTLFIASLISLNPVPAAEDHFDAAMGKVINSYLLIRQKLAQDSLEGVAAEAGKITHQAETVEKMHAKHPKHKGDAHERYELVKEAAGHAAHLSHGDITSVRKHFALLSPLVIKYVAEFGQPHNVSGELFNYHCPMYPGNWLQEDKNVGNPMYGKKMLKCGKLVEWSGQKQGESPDMGHEHSGEHHPGH